MDSLPRSCEPEDGAAVGRTNPLAGVPATQAQAFPVEPRLDPSGWIVAARVRVCRCLGKTRMGDPVMP